MNILLFTVLFCSAICDLKFRKVPNGIIILGFFSAISYLLLLSDYHHLFSRMIVSISIFIFLYLFFQIGVLGAGDIKLLMVMALFLNISELLQIIFISMSITIIQLLVLKFKSVIQTLNIKIPLANSLFWGYWLWIILFDY